MKIKEYFEKEQKVILFSSFVAIIVGYISFFINSPLVNLVVAIAAVIALNAFLKKVWKISEDKKWWLGNSTLIFLLVWFVSWVVFFNLFVR